MTFRWIPRDLALLNTGKAAILVGRPPIWGASLKGVSMPKLADLPEIVGFFSYSRDDDRDSEGGLSTLRRRLQSELRGQLGRSEKTLRLWQDAEAIPPGTLWDQQIETAIQQSVFFIPIITPRVINSEYCGIEFQRFLNRERQLSRFDLVFPIIYIEVPQLKDERRWRGHPVLHEIGARQYVDWSEFRFEPNHPDVRRAIAEFSRTIRAALDREMPDPQPGSMEAIAAKKKDDHENKAQPTVRESERAAPENFVVLPKAEPLHPRLEQEEKKYVAREDADQKHDAAAAKIQDHWSASYPPKLRAALGLLAATGRPKRQYAPWTHRLLWRFGLYAPPPLLASFGSNFLFAAIITGLLFGGFQLMVLDDAFSFFFGGIFFGCTFGWFAAAYIRRQARKLNLPSWSELESRARSGSQ